MHDCRLSPILTKPNNGCGKDGKEAASRELESSIRRKSGGSTTSVCPSTISGSRMPVRWDSGPRIGNHTRKHPFMNAWRRLVRAISPPLDACMPSLSRPCFRIRIWNCTKSISEQDRSKSSSYVNLCFVTRLQTTRSTPFVNRRDSENLQDFLRATQGDNNSED